MCVCVCVYIGLTPRVNPKGYWSSTGLRVNPSLGVVNLYIYFIN